MTAQGRTHSATINASSLRSLLFVKGATGGVRIACGAVHRRGDFVPDWEMLVRVAPEGRAVVTVTGARTINGALINGGLLTTVRDMLGQILAGPLTLQTHYGVLDARSLIQASVMRKESWYTNDRSPFANDNYMPLPPGFSQNWHISLPPGGAHVMAGAAHRTSYPWAQGQGSCLASLDLSGGRSSTQAWLMIGTDQAGDRIEVIPGAASSVAGGQRTFRAAMTALRRIADGARQEMPAASQAIDDYVQACVDHYQRDDRAQFFQPMWDKDTPIDVLPARAGLPVAICALTTVPDLDLFSRLYCAQTWLLVQQRTVATGFGKNKRNVYLSRRPVFLKKEDGVLAGRLRYMSYYGGDRPDIVYSDGGNGDGAIFWECRIRWQDVGDGRRQALLLVDAVSQTDGLIGYGAELLTLMRAFCWSIASIDPAAQFTALHL